MSERKRLKAWVNPIDCVACGQCVPTCPKNAIVIFHGMYAVVEKEKCIGCTKCTRICPATTISMKEEEPSDE